MLNKTDEFANANQELATLELLTMVLYQYQDSNYPEVQSLLDKANDALNEAQESLSKRVTDDYNDLDTTDTNWPPVERFQYYIDAWRNRAKRLEALGLTHAGHQVRECADDLSFVIGQEVNHTDD